MVLLVILLVLIALFAYGMGNTNTLIFGSRYIYHRSLFAYRRNNLGLTLFLKDSSRKQIFLLILTEVVRVAVPVMAGGWLMHSYNISQLGRAFAMFCLLLGNNFPLMYRFKGQPSLATFAIAATCVYPQLGIATVFVFLIVYFVTRYISLSAMIAAFAAFVMSIVAIDIPAVHWLFFACFVLVMLEYRKNIVRLIQHKEPKWRYKRDISYMFDE